VDSEGVRICHERQDVACQTLQHTELPGSIPNIMKPKRKWTVREEANAITVWAFRNGYIEELHAGKYSELLEQPGLSRITDAEMKKLNVGISTKIAEILTMRDTNPEEYEKKIDFFLRYCAQWEK
jgi:hypothetical protein